MQARISPLPAGARWMLLVSALFCFSCSRGPTLYPVEGQVKFKGQPVEGATVVFHPVEADAAKALKAVRPVGQTDAGGNFTLTYGRDDAPGAPAGEYTVTITKSELAQPKGKEGVISTAPPETRDAFGMAYTDAGKSKIKVQVQPGPNQLAPFDLK